jgi:hypothetical protein
MDKRKANIDLLFRNGLKDFEVLPPPEVWNNILPVIRKKQRYAVLLRTAAMVALLFSISFLAYRFSRQIPSSFNEPVISFGQDQIFNRVIPADPVLVRIMPSGDRLAGSGTGGQEAGQLSAMETDTTDDHNVPAPFITETVLPTSPAI